MRNQRYITVLLLTAANTLDKLLRILRIFKNVVAKDPIKRSQAISRPLMNGSCRMELISLKVSQYFTLPL